jgi:hypothetical protein
VDRPHTHRSALAPPTMQLGLFFFGGDETGLGRERYRLV